MGGTADGGAGVVLQWGEDTITWNCPAGSIASSFRSECVALLAALRALEGRLRGASGDAVRRVRVCSDSLSALTALSFGPVAQRHHVCSQVWDALEACAAPDRTFDLVWIPGHAGLAGNEEADAAAAAGGAMNQADQPTDFATARAALRRWAAAVRLNRYEESVPPDHHHRRATGGRPLPRGPWTPSEERTLRLLRVDRHPQCLATLARWSRRDDTGNPVSGECPACPGRQHNAAHILLQCALYEAVRLSFLGPDPDADILHLRPRAVLAYLRRIGFLRGTPG